ncbi:MAG: sensor histidine kinase [Streptosporangiaceae bacterium]
MSRPTVRTRLAVVYGGLFLASAAAILALTILFLHTGVGSVTPVPGTATSGPGTGLQQATSSDVRQVAVSYAVAFAIIGVFSVALGWLIAGRLLRPLRTIAATARHISVGNLHQRLALDGPDGEFRELGLTLDDLLGRLEASFESQRHFVANASHELQTPLTAGRTILQVALADPDATAQTLRSTCQKLLSLGDEQQHLIQALLTLASSERGIEQREAIDLAEIAGQSVLARTGEAGRRGIHLDAALTTALTAGDPALVASLVANLVDNALRHNVAGGRVTISTITTAGRASISVGNTGPVIPAGEVSQLLQPFQRLGAERVHHSDGHGLGLAIVHAIATAHDATLAARPRPKGGLDIEVSFPAPGSLRGAAHHSAGKGQSPAAPATAPRRP